MTIFSSYCNSILSNLTRSMADKANVVLAHESGIKKVPIDKPYVAIGIKKCSLSSPIIQKNEDGADITNGDRKVQTTVSINIYTPYSKGAKGCVEIYEEVLDSILLGLREALVETRLFGTKYSRETQCIVGESEFVFETILSDFVSVEPIVSGK